MTKQETTSRKRLGIYFIITIFIIIVYAIFVLYAYIEKKFMFAPYMRPDLPNSFHPQGHTVHLTPAEQKQRQVQISGTGPAS